MKRKTVSFNLRSINKLFSYFQLVRCCSASFYATQKKKKNYFVRRMFLRTLIARASRHVAAHFSVCADSQATFVVLGSREWKTVDRLQFHLWFMFIFCHFFYDYVRFVVVLVLRLCVTEICCLCCCAPSAKQQRNNNKTKTRTEQRRSFSFILPFAERSPLMLFFMNYFLLFSGEFWSPFQSIVFRFVNRTFSYAFIVINNA